MSITFSKFLAVGLRARGISINALLMVWYGNSFLPRDFKLTYKTFSYVNSNFNKVT